MTEVRIRLSEGGRIAIPAEYQHALGIRPGDEVTLRLEEDRVLITTLRQPSGETNK